MTLATSKEGCATCAHDSGTDAAEQGQEQGQGVTYDEGDGIKNNVVISGPMSDVIAHQLNVVFKKTEFNLSDGAPAMETIAQDTALAAVFHEVSKRPDNQVILSNFDVTSIKDHMERMHAGKATNEDVANLETINVIAGTPDELLDGPTIGEYYPSSTDEMLVVAVPDSSDTHGESDDMMFVIRNPATMISQALRNEPSTPSMRMAKDEPSLNDKIEAIERLYAGQVKRIHRSVESFIQSLVERAQTK